MRTHLILLLLLPLLGCAMADEHAASARAASSTGGGGTTCTTCPGPAPTLEAPATFRISQRASDSLKLQWRDRTELEDGYELLRRTGDTGSFQRIRTFGKLSGWTEVQDSGRSPDTLYCYRVRVYQGTTSKLTPMRCAYTKPSQPRPIVRMQVELKVANVANAGTHDPVVVRLNSPWMVDASLGSYLPQGNRTWLDRGGPDFARGSTAVYDVTPVSDLGDMTLLSLEKVGTDGLCLERVRVIANRTDASAGVVVFEHTFGGTATTCKWIDGDDGAQPIVSFLQPALRGNARWPRATDPWCGLTLVGCTLDSGLFPMSFETLEDRVEGLVGDFLHAVDAADWRPQPTTSTGTPIPFEWVQASYVDQRTLHLRLRLRGHQYGLDPDVDVDADLRVHNRPDGDGSSARFELRNLKTDLQFNLLLQAAGSILPGAFPVCYSAIDCLELLLEGEIEDVLGPIAPHYPLGANHLCSVLKVVPTGAGGGALSLQAVRTCEDLDDDGMLDAWELEHGLDPGDPTDADRDPDGDGASNLMEFLHDTDPLCRWNPGDAFFCRDCGPCAAGEGNCASDGQCTAGLACHADRGAAYGMAATVDVCECPVPVNDADYCRLCGPCPAGVGDCDSDDECAGPHVVCKKDVGAKYGLPANWDVCECDREPGDGDYCAVCGPCEMGEGDCDGDQCAPGLACAADRGAAFGFSENTDVCLCAPGALCPPLTSVLDR